MRALLLPVKDLRHAKQRLAPFLNAAERLGLVQAMLADTVRAIRGVRQAEKIFVVTNYIPAMEAAEQNGWDLLREDRQISESFSVDYASMQCAKRGVTALLRLPLDVPLVQSSDIDELLAVECAAPGLVIVPSRDGTGTNAILRTPPSLFPSHFGSGSFANHCAEAQRVDAHILIRRNARLEMDVDDETDLRVLVQQDLSGTETGVWLQSSGLMARLRQPNIVDKSVERAATL
ncbi:MAG TPA: 2-phospho-L-lactate guanylyltransferase [Candidatus Acidoferrales bacterium]|nr:2-phospho-L-lactate guanylyltransferase [Candidatus Acidoferrales bacterium]